MQTRTNLTSPCCARSTSASLYSTREPLIASATATARRSAAAPPKFVANMAVSFIDRSSEIWNFCPRQKSCLLSWHREKGTAMKKSLMALVGIATLAASVLAAPAPAHAQRGVGVGIAAGLLGGAIIGGAIASSPYYYGPGYYPSYYRPYGYYGGPAYVADDPYGGCVWQRQRFWDGYSWRVRSVRVCG